MKLNISFPGTGSQKLFEVDDEKKLRPFYEKRMGHEVDAGSLGEEWKGYVVRIAGGNDKQGFPMKQGVLTNNRVRLLLHKGHSCYRPRRTGERKRKSVRGCVVDSNLSVLALVVIRKGTSEIQGLTDKVVPRKLGPKRASKIRKLFNLDKKDDVRRYVIKRPLTGKEGKKPKTKAPKIQRLITPSVLLHRRHKNALKRLRRERTKEVAAEYAKLLATRQKEAREKRKEELRRRRSSMRESRSSAASSQPQEKRGKAAVTAAAPAKGKGKVAAVPPGKGKPVAVQPGKGKSIPVQPGKGKVAAGLPAKGRPSGAQPGKGKPTQPTTKGKPAGAPPGKGQPPKGRSAGPPKGKPTGTQPPKGRPTAAPVKTTIKQAGESTAKAAAAMAKASQPKQEHKSAVKQGVKKLTQAASREAKATMPSKPTRTATTGPLTAPKKQAVSKQPPKQAPVPAVPKPSAKPAPPKQPQSKPAGAAAKPSKPASSSSKPSGAAKTGAPKPKPKPQPKK